MNTVLFLSPPTRVINHYRPPMALQYLSGYLKKQGIASRIIDVVLREQIRNEEFFSGLQQTLQDVEDETIRQCMAEPSDIVGITCYTPEYMEVERMARRIKDQDPSRTIVVGGIHPTFFPQDFFERDSPFDYVVVGEGEITMFELVRHLREGQGRAEDIAGIAFRSPETGEMVVTEPRKLHDDLDDIASPDLDSLDMDFYVTPSPYAIRGVFTKSFYVLSSRGCPGTCAFCVAKKLRSYHLGKRVRLRSPESLFHEISTLRDRYGIDSFYFIDDLFTMRKENVQAFCDLMISHKMPLVWACSSRVNTVDRELLTSMRKAGCLQIDFGVEKGSDRALKQMKKGITVAQIHAAFDACRDLGIRTFANILVNTPGETEEDLADIDTLLEHIRPTICSINVFTPYPGCEVYDECCHVFPKEDYALLVRPAVELIREDPERFRFAAHSVDIEAWAGERMHRYNRVMPNLRTYLDRYYLRSFMASRDKTGYVRQFGNLVREFINQKF